MNLQYVPSWVFASDCSFSRCFLIWAISLVTFSSSVCAAFFSFLNVFLHYQTPKQKWINKQIDQERDNYFVLINKKTNEKRNEMKRKKSITTHLNSLSWSVSACISCCCAAISCFNLSCAWNENDEHKNINKNNPSKSIDVPLLIASWLSVLLLHN
jgi:hypothetical protein